MKSRGKANELCSLLCAYRLLEIITGKKMLEESNFPPMHKKMGINFSKNEVRTYVYSHIILPFFKKN